MPMTALRITAKSRRVSSTPKLGETVGYTSLPAIVCGGRSAMAMYFIRKAGRGQAALCTFGERGREGLTEKSHYTKIFNGGSKRPTYSARLMPEA